MKTSSPELILKQDSFPKAGLKTENFKEKFVEEIAEIPQHWTEILPPALVEEGWEVTETDDKVKNFQIVI